MSNINEIVSNAMDSLKTGNRMQTSIREMLRDTTVLKITRADMTARACEEFRLQAENWVLEHDKSEHADLRKKANNIVNDISRICRKEVGHTIKCKKRKPVYVYEAEVVTPKEPAPSSPPPAPTVDVTDEEKEALRVELKRLKGFLESPEAALQYCVDVFGLEETGKAAVEVLVEK
jgi:hypothetical protein